MTLMREVPTPGEYQASGSEWAFRLLHSGVKVDGECNEIEKTEAKDAGRKAAELALNSLLKKLQEDQKCQKAYLKQEEDDLREWGK